MASITNPPSLIAEIRENLVNVPKDACGSVLDLAIADRVMILVIMRGHEGGHIDDAFMVTHGGHSFWIEGPSDGEEARILPVVPAEQIGGGDAGPDAAILHGVRQADEFTSLVTDFARGVRAPKGIVLDATHKMDPSEQPAPASPPPAQISRLWSGLTPKAALRAAAVVAIGIGIGVGGTAGYSLLASGNNARFPTGPASHSGPVASLAPPPHAASAVGVPRHPSLPHIQVFGNNGSNGRNLAAFGIHPGNEVSGDAKTAPKTPART